MHTHNSTTHTASQLRLHTFPGLTKFLSVTGQRQIHTDSLPLPDYIGWGYVCDWRSKANFGTVGPTRHTAQHGAGLTVSAGLRLLHSSPRPTLHYTLAAVLCLAAALGQLGGVARRHRRHGCIVPTRLGQHRGLSRGSLSWLGSYLSLPRVSPHSPNYLSGRGVSVSLHVGGSLSRSLPRETRCWCRLLIDVSVL